jgi:myo-inositol-1(or 4)-monophosphatase
MHSEPDPNALLECATAAAQTAGSYALQNWNRRQEVFQRFKHDVKLRLDLESQARAEAVIRARFPEHAVLGEEQADPSASEPAGDAFRWVIDPIDGTVNFSHGFPIWCCSVAVQHRGEVVAGAVYAPALQDLYQATAAGPALCNGAPLRVSEVDTLAGALVFTGLDKSVDPLLPPFALFERIAASVQKARIIGSAALDICHVAAGRGDGYFEAGIYLWDVAAAGLIVRRAGGQAETLSRREGHRLRFLATNGRIHEALKAVVNVDWPTEGI